MWHDLATAIGGCTVAELKQRMSYPEYLSWIEYMRKRGTLHTGLRLERGFALVAEKVLRAAGINADMKDFMPHFDIEQQPVSLSEAMRQWK